MQEANPFYSEIYFYVTAVPAGFIRPYFVAKCNAAVVEINFKFKNVASWIGKVEGINTCSAVYIGKFYRIYVHMSEIALVFRNYPFGKSEMPTIKSRR